MAEDCNECKRAQRDVSQLAIDVAVLKIQTEALTKTCDKLGENVATLTNMLNQSKGGWFILTTVASMGAVVAGGVFALFQYFKG